jgi:hypothetical protein
VGETSDLAAVDRQRGVPAGVEGWGGRGRGGESNRGGRRQAVRLGESVKCNNRDSHRW